MYEELAQIADEFLTAELARVDDITRQFLSQATTEDVENNELLWWLMIVHQILDDIVTRLPFDQRQQVLAQGTGAERIQVPVERIIQRVTARVDVLATTLRARVEEGKIGGLLGESLIDSIVDTLTLQITAFIQELDTALSLYDRLFLARVGKEMKSPLWVYAGPRDNRNRPFCRAVLDERRAYTEAEIDTLNDHPLLHSYVPPNVRTLCGGYGCRHVFAPITTAQAQKEGLAWDSQ